MVATYALALPSRGRAVGGGGAPAGGSATRAKAMAESLERLTRGLRNPTADADALRVVRASDEQDARSGNAPARRPKDVRRRRPHTYELLRHLRIVS